MREVPDEARAEGLDETYNQNARIPLNHNYARTVVQGGLKSQAQHVEHKPRFQQRTGSG